MGFLSRLQVIEEKDKSQAVRKLVEDSTPDFDFYLMVILSILMATFGLLAGSETIVIGSMLIAPILHPVLGLSLGVSMSNHKLIRRSIRTIAMAVLFAIGASIVATFLFSFGHFEGIINDTIISRTSPSLIFLAVAVISGFAVTYALVKPELSETLPGVAVSVALIPPLAVIGIGIARFDPSIVSGSVVMFGVNILGILAASMFAFSIMNVHGKEKIAQSTINKEDKRIQMEEKEVKKIEEIKEKVKSESK
jgi:uncharacterized hydrophobic protein (TIGR00271 family)